MSVYQQKFTVNNRSNTDFGLIVCSFTPDNGEMDSYLTMESVYTESFDGSKRHDYGAKYKEPVVLYITMVKNNYADLSRKELREILDWLTGLRKVSWLDLYNDDTGDISYSFLGRITDVKLEKMDSRIIGLKAEFTSISPWAYSKIERNEMSLDGNMTRYSILNGSDEVGVYIYPNITFINKTPNGTLKIVNQTTGEETILKNLGMNEVINIDSNKTIYSDKPSKIFGEDFNFKWLRFAQGYNHIDVTGVGHLIIEHRDIMKVADAFDNNSNTNIDPSYKNALLLTTVELPAVNWTRINNLPKGNIVTYSQVVPMQYVTGSSLINLQPNEEQELELQGLEIEIQMVNNNGFVTAYAYGGAPTNDYIFQATIEETDLEITHNYASLTLYKNGWVGQGNVYTQPVFIRDLTENSIVDLDLTEAQKALLVDYESTLFIRNENKTAIAYSLVYPLEEDFDINVVVTETTTDPNNVRQWSNGSF